LNKENKLTTVFVTVVDGAVKLLNKNKDGSDGSDGGTYDFTSPCPPVCDDASPLNGDR